MTAHDTLRTAALVLSKGLDHENPAIRFTIETLLLSADDFQEASIKGDQDNWLWNREAELAQEILDSSGEEAISPFPQETVEDLYEGIGWVYVSDKDLEGVDTSDIER